MPPLRSGHIIRQVEVGVPRKYARRYPWNEWFSKDCFTIRRGVDYDCRTYAMDQMVRTAAARKQYRLKVSIKIAEDGDSLTVTVHRG